MHVRLDIFFIILQGQKRDEDYFLSLHLDRLVPIVNNQTKGEKAQVNSSIDKNKFDPSSTLTLQIFFLFVFAFLFFYLKQTFAHTPSQSLDCQQDDESFGFSPS